MKPRELSDIFIQRANAFADSVTQYKSEESESKTQSAVFFRINSFALELVFRLKGDITVPPCTLFCRFYPCADKNDFFQLYEIMNAVAPDNLSCLVFPYIESEERLDACFEALTNQLSNTIPLLDSLSHDLNLLSELEARREAELRKVFSLKDKHFPDDPDARKDYILFLCFTYESAFFLPCFTTDEAYYAFLSGKYAKALRLYRKKKFRTAYEDSIIKRISESDTPIEAISDGCFAFRIFKSLTMSLDLLNLLLCFALTFGVFCGIYAIFNAFLSYGSIYSPYIPWVLIVAGISIIPALLASLTFRRGLTALLRPHRFEVIKGMFDIEMSDRLKTVINLIYTALLALSVFLLMVFASTQLRFYSDHLTEPSTGTPLPWIAPTAYQYSDVVGIYGIEYRFNDFGDRIDRASKLIAFKNGYMLDLDGYLGSKEDELYIEALLSKYAGETVYVADEAAARSLAYGE